MRSHHQCLLLLSLLVLSYAIQWSDAVGVTTTTSVERKRRHREDEEDTAPPPPPLPLLEEMLRHPPPGFPRFNQIRAGEGPIGGSNVDIVKSIYNLLSQKRDANQEESAKVIQAKADAIKKQEELLQKAKELEDRSSMLTRLQFCLEQDAQNKLVDPIVNVTGSDQDSAKLQQQRNDLTKVAEELQRKKTELELQAKELARKEDALSKKEKDVKDQASQVQEQRLKLIEEQLRKSKQGPPACPSTCAYETTCGGCVENPKCGWCRSTQKCMDVSNPASPTNCSAADFNYLFCRQETCEQHKTCHSCLADPQCGMCVKTGKCQKGSLTGPAAGTCSNWYFASPLTFLSLNIYGRDVNKAAARAPYILGLIKQSNADFVALQEVEDWFLEALAQQDWAHNYYASDFGSGHAPGGLLVLSKYPLLHIAYHEKTQPGQVEVDQRGRILMVRPKFGTNNLVITNTHLDWRTSASRVESMDFIFSLVNSTADAVVMGDFNFDDGSLPETDHIPPNVRDIWPALRNNQTGFTWDPITNEFARTADANSRPSRIDRIFVKSDYFFPSKIIKVGNTLVSPHYGLFATMQFFNAYC